MDALEQLGHALMGGFALGLGLPERWFAEHGTADPLILLRLFNYPSRPVPRAPRAWGVGEHTDYGLLTMLLAGRRRRARGAHREGWIDAPPLPGTFVCNIGDMLDRMTGGRYRSRRIGWPSTRAAATGCRSRSSSTPTSTRASSRCPAAAAGADDSAALGRRRTCTRSRARMATTCCEGRQGVSGVEAVGDGQLTRTCLALAYAAGAADPLRRVLLRSTGATLNPLSSSCRPIRRLPCHR